MDQQPPARNVIIAFVIVVVIIAAGMIALLSTRPAPVQITVNPPIPTATAEPTGTPAPILVYVTGAVGQPESLISLPVGSRVQDAIEAAGGIADDADTERVNLAAILHDGDQVHVPQIDEEPMLPTPSGGEIVHINTASVEELDTLPGVGPALAQRIIDYRDANGPFADLTALDEVSGIGPALLEGLDGLVAFD